MERNGEGELSGGQRQEKGRSSMSEPMSLEEVEKLLAEVDAYCSQATPGPWTVELCNSGESCWCRVLGCKDDGYGNDYLVPSGSIRKKDAEFAARARTDLPRLVALLREQMERDRWVPVSAGLPDVRDSWSDHGSTYFVTADVLATDGIKQFVVSYAWERGEDGSWSAGDTPVTVTAWRPLPAPPEVTK